MTQVFSALRFAPALPLWALAALLLAGTAICALGVIRRARGAWLRAASFAVLLAWLAGPVLVRETRQGLRDIALLVVDRSDSMQVGDRRHLADTAVAALRQQATRLPDLELRQVNVPEHGSNGTQLWAEITRALAEIPQDRLAGIMAVTDGQVHDLPAAPPAAPLHALLTASGEQWDRRVRVIEAPSYGIVGRALTLRVVVEDLGGPGAGGAPEPGGTANLTLRRDGAPPVIQTVPLGVPQEIPADITRAGPSVLEFSTDPPAGEASALNDRAVVQINGVRDRLRVLLVSGEPNQDERTWRRLLKSDPAVDLVHFTILRPPERDDLTPLNELALIAFPTRELFQDKLSGFDLIILDRFTDRGILPHAYLRNIAQYVRHGGALLLTAGPEFASPESLDQTPLADVLPAHAPAGGSGVIVGAFRPMVTALGARHPVTEGLTGANQGDPGAPGSASPINSAPTWGPWYRAIASEDVAGQVVMTGPSGVPLLVLSHADQGRVAVLLSDQIWLWSRGHMGGGPQAELLRRIAHWAMGEPELDEERLSATIAGKRLTVIRRTVEGEAATLARITPPEGARQDLALRGEAPGLAAGQMEAAAPGVWRVEAAGRQAFAAAGQDNPLEFADLRATADRLGPLVRGSGGGVVWLGAAGAPRLVRVGEGQTASGAGWIGLRRRGAHLVTGVQSVPLLPPWAALPLLLGLALAAWRREAR